MTADTVTVMYTGDHPVSIISDNIGMVEHGDTFPVPADRVDAYTRRADMTLASAQKPKKTSTDTTPEPSA